MESKKKKKKYRFESAPARRFHPCTEYTTRARQSIWSIQTSQVVLQSGHSRREEKKKGKKKKEVIVISGLLRHIVLSKISHPTKMAAPRRARMTHQLTRSGCDRGRVKRIIKRHDIGSVIAFSVFASRYRRRTVKTRREFHRGSRRGRLWCWKES